MRRRGAGPAWRGGDLIPAGKLSPLWQNKNILQEAFPLIIVCEGQQWWWKSLFVPGRGGVLSPSLTEASHWSVSPLNCPLIGQCWHDNEVWLLKLNTQLQVLSSTLPPPLLVISNRTQIVSWDMNNIRIRALELIKQTPKIGPCVKATCRLLLRINQEIAGLET